MRMTHMNEQQKKILAELQSRTSLISEDEFLWIISILGAHGCDDQGNTFLHLAAARGFERACKEILLSGHHSEHPNGIGKTPAVVALENGHLDLALLIKSGSGFNGQGCPVSPVDSRRNQNRGTFDPTPSTRLMDADTDWSLPEDLKEPVPKSDATSEFEAGEELEALARALSDKLNAAKINPLHSSLLLYLRFSEMFRKIYFCNGCFDDGDIFTSWVEDTLEQSDAIAGFANRIASETYSLRSKMHDHFISLRGELKTLLSLLEWIKKTNESQSVCDRAVIIEENAHACMKELEGLTSEALGFADSLTSVDIEEMIGSSIKEELMHCAKEWISEYGQKTEVISQICRIVQDDLFLDAVSSDIGLLNPARKVIISKDLFEYFEKSDNLEYWDAKDGPQWNTKLWSVDEKN